jgi:hypothetical protein
VDVVPAVAVEVVEPAVAAAALALELVVPQWRLRPQA